MSVLPRGQHRHRCVVAVQPLGGQCVGLDTRKEWRQGEGASADLIGQGREAERHAFPGVALGLAVQRLMLAELLEQDRRQQVGPGPAAGCRMERRRRLSDGLAVPARDLLPHGLDDLPLPEDDLQGLGDVFPQAWRAWCRRSRGMTPAPAGPPARAAGVRGRAGATGAGGHGLQPRSPWRQPSRPRGRLRWPRPPAPRAPTPFGRTGAPSVPIAGHRSAGAASRSRASSG
ncbi:hypothetical protein DES42_105375 [Zavarzinia compransoris]|nr:hypothetical protein DES42_105375 [Zavarzinia compransoris]